MAACEPYSHKLVPAVEKSGPDACEKTGQHKLRLEEVFVGGFNCLFIELSDICIILCGTLYLYFNFLFVIIFCRLRPGQGKEN